MEGPPGAQNETLTAPIAEHVKNTLRGRRAWGLQHGLSDTWAELPRGKVVLSKAVAFPGPLAKRRRSGTGARAVPVQALT